MATGVTLAAPRDRGTSKAERIYCEVRVHAIGGDSEEIMRDLAARQIGL